MTITDYLAIYGALLSTAGAAWNVQRARPKNRVELIFAVETFEGVTLAGIGISVQNPSAHAVHIANVSFLYRIRGVTFRERMKDAIRYRRLPKNAGWCSSSLSNYDIDDRCPATIEPGKSHWIFVPENKLESIFENATSRELKAAVQDALWRNTYSRRFTYPAVAK